MGRLPQVCLRPMWRGLLIAFLLSFGPAVSNSFARFAYALLLPAMREDLQWNWSQAGALNTVNAFGYLLGALLVRGVVNHTGNRRLFCAGMVLTALALLATGFTRDITWLMTLRVLTGVGGAAIFICGGALSGNVLPQRPAMATTTIGVFFAGGGLGLMLSGAVLPPMLDAQGPAAWPIAWREMGMAGLVMAVAAIWAALQIEEPGAAAGSARWRLAPMAAEFTAYALFAVGYIGYMTFVIAWMRAQGASTGEVVAVWCLLGLATWIAPWVWRVAAHSLYQARPRGQSRGR